MKSSSLPSAAAFWIASTSSASIARGAPLSFVTTAWDQAIGGFVRLDPEGAEHVADHLDIAGNVGDDDVADPVADLGRRPR